MTRKIDRIHELRRAEEAAHAERKLFAEKVEDQAVHEAARLRAALRLPPELEISYRVDPILRETVG